MFPIRYRKGAAWLLGALGVLFIAWLALPRLLGFAAEHWLPIPGVEDLRVDIATIGSGRVKLNEVRGVYRSAGGSRFQLALRDVVIDYSPTRRHIDRLEAATGEFDLFPAEKTPDSPWPLLAWPNAPLGEARVRDLRLTLHRAQGALLETRGDLELHQTDERLEADFRLNSGVLRMAALPGETLEITAEWQPTTGPAANARLHVGRQPTAQPVTLAANLPLPIAAEFTEAAGVKLPIADARGAVTLNAEAQLGETTGSIRSITGEADLAEASARLPKAEKPPCFSMAGKLRFAWQPQAAKLDLQPGWRWQVTDEADQVDVTGQLERSFSIVQEGDKTLGDGEFPFAVRSSRWGEWRGTAHHLRLTGGAAFTDWRSAEAEVRFKGQMPRWQQGHLQLHKLQATGDATLGWTPSTGINSKATVQIKAEQLALAGDLPWSIARSEWRVTAEATAKPQQDMWQTLAVHGEASSPSLKVDVGAPTKRTITLGPARVQLRQFSTAAAGGLSADLMLAADAIRTEAHWPAPDLRAHVVLERGRVRADGNVLLQGEETARFAGTHGLTNGCGDATLTTRQRLPMLGEHLQPRPPMLAPLALAAGDADADFTFNWCAAPNLNFDGKGTLHLKDAAIGWEKARLQGLNATAQLDGLHPLRGRIQLAAERGELATGTELAKLDVDLALDERTLRVNALSLDLLGGNVRSEPATLPWPLTEHTLPLTLRQIDIGQLLALLKVNGLSGSGRLDGVLPLAYRDGALEIHDGHLDSTSAGTLKYAPSLTIPDNPGLQALRNLHFQKLGMRLNYAANGAYRTESTLEGNNPDFYDGYPVRFNLNINGELPGLFRSALFSGDFNRHILEQLQSGKLQ